MTYVCYYVSRCPRGPTLSPLLFVVYVWYVRVYCIVVFVLFVLTIVCAQGAPESPESPSRVCVPGAVSALTYTVQTIEDTRSSTDRDARYKRYVL